MSRLITSLRVRYLQWQADRVLAEREQYEAAGCVGLDYLINSHIEELHYRLRAKRIRSEA